MELTQWQEFLRERMTLLDGSWAALDDVWELAPADVEGEISELADRFYQSYWDVFHAAVECSTIEELSTSVPEAIEEAQEHVAEAWRILADSRVRRLERSLDQATRTVSSPLAKTRELLRAAKEARRNAGRLIGDSQFLAAVGVLKDCIIKCDGSESELDDALRAEQHTMSQFRWTRARVVIAALTLLLAVALGIIGHLLRAKPDTVPVVPPTALQGDESTERTK